MAQHSEPMPGGVTEAGGTFRPLRLYRTSRRRSGGQAI
jgi:hypothetical protein